MPSAYARDFAVILYDINLYILVSTEVVQDVAMSPTLVDAVIKPAAPAVFSGEYLAVAATGWHTFQINFPKPLIFCYLYRKYKYLERNSFKQQ